MKKEIIMKNVSSVLSRTKIGLRKYGPDILVVAGIAGTIVSTVLIVYTCVYALVNRIATCIERCAMAKSVSKIDIFDGKKKEEDTDESVILK